MEEEMEFVQKTIEEAKKANMLAEVIYSSLIAMKENSELSIQSALHAGCEEWDV